jgi:sterol O-acyltransferase
MLMKVHSYCAFNGAASEKAIQMEQIRKKLDKAVEEKGGWKKVIAEAEEETSRLEDTNEKNGDTHAISTALSPLEPVRSRRRSSDRGKRPYTRQQQQQDDVNDPHLLVDYSDAQITKLANEYADLDDELTSTGKDGVSYPHNLTYANYLDYLLIPTLVYELEYPRTSSIRPLYVVEKTLATFGTFFLIYAITEHVIIPHHEAAKGRPYTLENSIAIALDLVMPFMINYLLIFYIIFECICNGFAELTRFADRGFYEDWWNAVTWDEFARKWNKPVHHVSIGAYYVSEKG